MAVDRKADHVGNHGGRYTDMDGHTKQFTYIDHDPKTKISTYAPTEEEKKAEKERYEKMNKERIEEILAMPAVSAVMSDDPFIEQVLYEEFVKRESDGIKWNKELLTEACTLNTELARTLHLRVWRRTVKEQHWFDEMSHEDIVAGKWRQLM